MPGQQSNGQIVKSAHGLKGINTSEDAAIHEDVKISPIKKSVSMRKLEKEPVEKSAWKAYCLAILAAVSFGNANFIAEDLSSRLGLKIIFA